MANEEARPPRSQAPGMSDDLITSGALDLDCDERLWVPQSKDVEFRPLLLSASQGQLRQHLRVRRSGILSRHRHAGAVHAFTLRRRAGTTWNTTGGLKQGSTRSSRRATSTPSRCLKTSPRWSPCSTSARRLHLYVDVDGNTVGIEDVFSKIDKARARYEKIGLRSCGFVGQFIRLTPRDGIARQPSPAASSSPGGASTITGNPPRHPRGRRPAVRARCNNNQNDSFLRTSIRRGSARGPNPGRSQFRLRRSPHASLKRRSSALASQQGRTRAREPCRLPGIDGSTKRELPPRRRLRRSRRPQLVTESSSPTGDSLSKHVTASAHDCFRQRASPCILGAEL